MTSWNKKLVLSKTAVLLSAILICADLSMAECQVYNPLTGECVSGDDEPTPTVELGDPLTGDDGTEYDVEQGEDTDEDTGEALGVITLDDGDADTEDTTLNVAPNVEVTQDDSGVTATVQTDTLQLTVTVSNNAETTITVTSEAGGTSQIVLPAGAQTSTHSNGDVSANAGSFAIQSGNRPTSNLNIANSDGTYTVTGGYSASRNEKVELLTLQLYNDLMSGKLTSLADILGVSWRKTARKSRSSDEDHTAILNTFESSRNFTAFEDYEGDDSIQSIEVIPSSNALFEEVTTTDSTRYLSLTSGSASMKVTYEDESGETQTSLISLEEDTAYELPARTVSSDSLQKPINSGQWSLQEGWNLIGHPVSDAKILTDYISESLIEEAWTYSTADDSWSSSMAEMQTNEAMWVKLSGATTVTLTETGYTNALEFDSGWNLKGSGSEMSSPTVNYDLFVSYKYYNSEWSKDPIKVYRGQGFWALAK